MVSNTHSPGEGWGWIDTMKEDVCTPPVNGVYYPDKILPTFLHYCQFFRVGELGFQKRRIRKSIFDCDKPILQEPPMNLSSLRYKNRDGEIMKLGPQQSMRNAFMICVLHRSINAMVTDYKMKMCPDLKTINLQKSLNMAVDW
jgi:hypothetical protein